MYVPPRIAQCVDGANIHSFVQAQGCPAAGMRVTLARITAGEDGDGDVAVPVAEFVTNSDGRTGKALAGAEFAPGTYEWVFYAGTFSLLHARQTLPRAPIVIRSQLDRCSDGWSLFPNASCKGSGSLCA